MKYTLFEQPKEAINKLPNHNIPYGFMLTQIVVDAEANRAYIKYTAQDAKNNLVSKNNKTNTATIVEPSDEVTFIVNDVNVKDFQFEDAKLTSILSCIEFLIKNYPDSAYNVLRRIPTSLYLDKAVMKKTIAMLPKNDQNLTEFAINMLKIKYKTIKSYQENQKTTTDKIMDAYDEIFGQ